jgi:ABC-type transport system involved in cytochrome c biogenesis permease component
MRRIGLLLAKDLRVLGRSPALLAAFLLYPLLIAALVGVVVRYAGERPKVAFVDSDGLPDELVVGGETFDVQRVLGAIDDEVELQPLSAEEADRRLEDGRVVAEIVVPRGFASKLRGLVESPTLVLKTGRGGLAGRAELEMQALVYRLNQLLQKGYIDANLGYVNLLLEGGKGEFVGNEFDIIGLEKAGVLLEELKARTADPGARERIQELQVFVRETKLAVAETGSALRSVANPIELETETSTGRTWLLSAQVQAYAFALTLAFVSVLLAAAAIASERDENTLGRLTRGLVRLRELVAEKVVFAALVGAALGLALALVFGIVVEAAGLLGGEPWARLPLLAAALLLTGAAFAAFGVLVGSLAREARTASLVGFLVALPLVLVGLLPAGTSGVVDWISRLFPLAHGVRLFEAALYDADPWGLVAREAAWLAALGVVYGAAARVGVRRLL